MRLTQVESAAEAKTTQPDDTRKLPKVVMTPEERAARLAWFSRPALGNESRFQLPLDPEAALAAVREHPDDVVREIVISDNDTLRRLFIKAHSGSSDWGNTAKSFEHDLASRCLSGPRARFNPTEPDEERPQPRVYKHPFDSPARRYGSLSRRIVSDGERD